MSDIDKRLDNIEQTLKVISTQQAPMFANNPAPHEDEIDLRELFNVLWKGKWIIIVVTFLFAVAGVFYAKSLPNIYKSQALLMPTQQSNNGLSGKVGGLASLAGLNLGAKNSVDKTELALKILESHDFLSALIQKNDLLVLLMASVNWDKSNNIIITNKQSYDQATQQWLVQKPSIQKAVEVLQSKIEIDHDKSSGFISITVEHYSPVVAKNWVNLLIKNINSEMKIRDLDQAKKSIKYLTNQVELTALSNLQSILYNLIEDQFKTVMFAEVTDEYVFKIVDNAVVPEFKDSPKRSLICFLFVVLGGLISVIVILIKYFLTKKNEYMADSGAENE